MANKYHQYISSPDWSTKRDVVLKKANHICEICGRKEALQAHHKTYAHLFNERDEDLIAVCRGCHARIHGIRSYHITEAINMYIPCQLCGSTNRDVYIDEWVVYYFCNGCGDTEIRSRKKRNRSGKRRVKYKKKNGKFICPVCKKKFKLSYSVSDHIKAKHGVLGKRIARKEYA